VYFAVSTIVGSIAWIHGWSDGPVGVALRWASCFSQVALSKNAFAVAPSHETVVAADADADGDSPPDEADGDVPALADDPVDGLGVAPPPQAPAISAATAMNDANLSGLVLPCMLLLLIRSMTLS
jgi:hypothetical protein